MVEHWPMDAGGRRRLFESKSMNFEPQTQPQRVENPYYESLLDSNDQKYDGGKEDSNESDDAGFDENHDWGLGDDEVLQNFDFDGFIDFGSDDIDEEEIDDKLNGYQSDDRSEVSDESEDEEIGFRGKAATANKENAYKRTVGVNISLSEGMTFTTKRHLLDVLRDFRVAKGFQVKQLHNDRKRYTASCKDESCQWRIHASMMRDDVSFQIRKYNGVHTCGRRWENGSAQSTWIASKFGDFIRGNPSIDMKTLADMLRSQYKVEVPNKTLWRAKKRALCGLASQHVGDYKLLRKYAYMVHSTNSGSKVQIRKITPDDSESPRFQRIYVSFAGQREGFIKGCRKFISVDECHLKGPFEGVLLSAVSIDTNSGVFPLAVAVAEGENKRSW